jgi:hypothetical protein
MMDSADRLEERFPKAIEKIAELFNYERTAMEKKLERLNAIYRVTEQKYNENIERLKKIDTQTRYVLFGEAAPWTPAGDVNYFYHNAAGSWCGRIWNAFFPKGSPTRHLGGILCEPWEKAVLTYRYATFCL